MKIGIIGSSGGSVLKTVFPILEQHSEIHHDFFVIVDRECQLYKYCQKKNIKTVKMEQPSNQLFSVQAVNQFELWGDVDIIFMFYSRIVTHHIFTRFPVINIHPSLLPDFKGFNAIEKALASGVSKLGATMHLADDNVDGGEIIAQISTSIQPIMRVNVKKAYTVSYIQKVWLMLLLIDQLENQKIAFTVSNNRFCLTVGHDKYNFSSPTMINLNYYQAVKHLQEKEHLVVI